MSKVPEFRATLSPGDAGTDETLAGMAAVVTHAVESPAVRNIVAKLRITGPNMAVPIVFGFLKRYTRFKRDPWGKELVRHPDELLGDIQRQGFAACDCDEVAVLGATILKAAGERPVFVVMARQPASDFEHVYFGVETANGYTPLDPQECDRPGKEIGAWRRKLYKA